MSRSGERSRRLSINSVAVAEGGAHGRHAGLPGQVAVLLSAITHRVGATFCLCTQLVSRIPWSSAEHRIRAAAASPQEAATLRIDAGAPCLVIERRTWDQDRPITHVRLTYPGESHEMVARFAPTLG